jgi:hypothetical protein
MATRAISPPPGRDVAASRTTMVDDGTKELDRGFEGLEAEVSPALRRPMVDFVHLGHRRCRD